MKRAKKRPWPTLAKLASSIKRTDRLLNETLAFCSASNKRIAKKEKRAASAVTAIKGLVRQPDKPVSIEAMRPSELAEIDETPAPRKKYKLADLMAEIPPGTKFDEWDIGPPVGKEIL